MSMMVNSYAFGAAASTRNIVVLNLESPGSAPVTTNYTSSAISGLTPAGALVIGSVHAVSADPGETADASFSFGSIVGSTVNYVTTRSRNGQASTSTLRDSNTTKPLEIYQGSGFVTRASGGSTISGGVSLTYTTSDVARRSMAIAFAGVGTQAKNGIVGLGTGTSAITVSGVGFQPDLVILYGHNDDFAAGQGQLLQYTFGFATGDGTQRSVNGAEVNALGAATPFQTILTDAAGGSNSTGGAGTKLVIGGFGSDGFTITPNSNQFSDDVAYLALKFASQRVKIVDLTTPISTGSQAITGAGFTPQAAIVVLTNLESTGSFAATTSDLQSGLSISLIADEKYSMAARVDSGADPTSTATTCRNVALLGASATSTSAIVASLTSFDSDGMTLNYSAVQGTAKKGFILFIE